MDDIFIYAAVSLICCLYLKKRRNKKWRTRRWWIRPINQRREEQGDYKHLFQELKNDSDLFFRYCRMDLDTFHILLDLLRPKLQKTNWRAIPPDCRLIITLRYLATGDQALSIAMAYRIGESTTLAIIKETSKIISDILLPKVIPFPQTNNWNKIIEDFMEIWNMPNCLGAVDGKHVQIQAPPNSGSQFFNYKKTFSVVLMGVCDANYKFTMVDIGAYGSNNDAGVFASSIFGKAFSNKTLNIPDGISRPQNSHLTTPAYFVGDDAFAMSPNTMKPFPGKSLTPKEKVFNYRLSRARRTIENSFGILVSRWRIFRKPICLHPNNVDKIIMATVCLHNFLMIQNEKKKPNGRLYCPPNYVDRETEQGEVLLGDWRQVQSVRGIPATQSRNATREAYLVRNVLPEYFLTPEGRVPWQEEYVRRGQNFSL